MFGLLTTHRYLVLFIVIIFTSVFLSSPAFAETIIVSVASDGTVGNDGSGGYRSPISADGRYVAFESSANNLVTGDTNGQVDIFVHDRNTGITTRVSVASDGTEGKNCGSEMPSISADGRYVAFQTCADNLVNDVTINTQVYVHDRNTGETTLVSRTLEGTPGEGASLEPSISADGRYVAFESYETNLVTDDTNGQVDIFVHDRNTGITTRVSVASDSTEANNNSMHASISADGRYVAFASRASNLVAGRGFSSQLIVYVHDRNTGETTQISKSIDGNEEDGQSAHPSISSNGRYVAFWSAAQNLLAGDTNVLPDIFVHDRDTGETTRVSVASDGSQAVNSDSYGGSDYPSISADGRYVAFDSYATNLTGIDDKYIGQQVYVHDRNTGETTLVSVASDGTRGNNDSRQSSISSAGQHVAFISFARNLVDNPGLGVQVYRVDYPLSKPMSNLTVSSDGTGSGTISSDPAGIDCGSDCSETYDEGTEITLTAAPDAGSTFTGWSGGGCSGTGTCTLTLDENTSVNATFDKNNGLPAMLLLLFEN